MLVMSFFLCYLRFNFLHSTTLPSPYNTFPPLLLNFAFLYFPSPTISSLPLASLQPNLLFPVPSLPSHPLTWPCPHTSPHLTWLKGRVPEPSCLVHSTLLYPRYSIHAILFALFYSQSSIHFFSIHKNLFKISTYPQLAINNFMPFFHYNHISVQTSSQFSRRIHNGLFN